MFNELKIINKSLKNNPYKKLKSSQLNNKVKSLGTN